MTAARHTAAPGLDPTTARLLHLVDRAIRGVALPAEKQALRDGVAALATTNAELASLSVNAANALADERRHHEIAAEEVARLRAALDRVNAFGPRLPPLVPGSEDYMNGHCAGWNDAIDAVMLAAALPAPDTQETTRG